MKYYLPNSYMQIQGDISGAATTCCPEKLYLDITEDCNLHCQMCRDTVQVDGKTMPLTLYKRLVDETVSYCKSYSLFNWGEPLILGDFRERVQYLYDKKRSDCIIEISTNGMLLDDGMIQFLRDHKVRVIVSFDGADKNVFEKIRRGAKFERICDNVKKLNKAYDDMPLEIAPTSYTSIQKDNQTVLTQIANTVSSLGFRRIGFGLVVSPMEYAASLDQKLCVELETAYESIRNNGMFLEMYPTRIGEYVFWGDKYVSSKDFIVRKRCDAPLVSASIRYDGEVCLCCNFGASVGNVTDKSFLELWKSKRYDELREAVNDHDTMPKKCRGCWWVNR